MTEFQEAEMSEKIQYGIDPDEYVKNNPFMEYKMCIRDRVLSQRKNVTKKLSMYGKQPMTS